MSNTDHPLRKLETRTYFSDVWGAKAFFGDGKKFPIAFSGATIDEATAKAEEFRKDVLGKYETAYRNRRKAILEAVERRKRKNAGIT